MDGYQASYFAQRLSQTARIQGLAHSIRFDLARSGLTDDELDRAVMSLGGEQEPEHGWGISTVLDDLMSRAPERIPITDMKTYQQNLINLGYAAPTTEPTGIWDPSWYGASRRLDRDMLEGQMSGKTMLAAPLRAGFELLGQTMPSNIYRNVVGWAKGFIEQTPETVERVGLLGGAAGGAAIGGIVGGPVGAGIGALVGGGIGLLGDLFGEDEDEANQSFWAGIADVLTPFEEYAKDPKAFMEDLGYIGTIASVVGGAKLAVSGISGIGASTTNALAAAGPADVQLGMPGSIVRWAAGQVAPNSYEAVTNAIARVSPVAHLTKYPAGAAVNSMFTGFSAASVGIHLTAGLGQNSAEANEQLRTQAAALVRAAGLQGRPLTEDELDLIDKANRGVGLGTIEHAISEVKPPGDFGSLNMGPQIFGMPLSDWLLPQNFLDIASFFLWPQQLLPIQKGALGSTFGKALDVDLSSPAQMARSWATLSDSEHQLRPWVQYFMADGISSAEARAFAKEHVSVAMDAWYRLDGAAKEHVARTLHDQAISQQERLPSFQQGRWDLIAKMRNEFNDTGHTSDGISLYGQSVARDTTFLAHLIETKPQGKSRQQAFLDHKAAMEDVERYNAIIVKGLDPEYMASTTGEVRHVQVARLPDEGVLALPFGRVSFTPDAPALERQRVRLEGELRALLDATPAGSPKALLAPNPRVQELRDQLAEIKKASEQTSIARAPEQYVLNLDRLDTPTRKDWRSMRKEYDRLAQKIQTLQKQLKEATGELDVAGMGTPALQDATMQLTQLLQGWRQRGYIYQDLMDAALASSKPHKSLTRFLEAQAKAAAVDADVPTALRQRLEARGYKPVITGENVFMPGSAEKWAEATGIGDYTRRRAFFESIGVREDTVRSDDLWKVRKATERAELQQVIESTPDGLNLPARELYDVIYNAMNDVNHAGVVWGPFNFIGKAASASGHPERRLFMIDVRSLRPGDIQQALEKAKVLPEGEKAWETSMAVYSALKRGAAFGGEWSGQHPVQTARMLGRALSLSGLPGFSDLIRTFHLQDQNAWQTKGVGASKLSKAKYAGIGAATGAIAGAVSGDEGTDVLQGAAIGAAVGLGTRIAARGTYGYLPDALTRLNSALRYTLSLAFDAGRISEQNMIAMVKYGLPPMFSPKKKIAQMGELRSPYVNGAVHGAEAWEHAIRFWDDVTGTSWYKSLDDTDRRMFQSGLLGFQPRNWEAAQAFMLYQRGWDAAKIEDAVKNIGRYGVGRSAAEKSANFVFFPFSFSKKLLTTLGDFAIQAPGRNLMIYEGMRRWYESTLDTDFHQLVEDHIPLLETLSRINNLSYGISPGRWFLSGLGDQRTNWGKASFILSQFFAPSGSATPLAGAAGAYGDLAINAFVPIVVTGEAIDRLGGVEGLDDVLNRYIPFTREVTTYWNAINEQKVAATQGKSSWAQVEGYLDEKRAFTEGLKPMAAIMGYASPEGFLQSAAGAAYALQWQQMQTELDAKYPSALDTLEKYSSDADHSARILMELADRPDPSAAEETILNIARTIEGYQNMSNQGFLPPETVDMLQVQAVRQISLDHLEDRRFRELYRILFERNFGPLEITA